MRDLCSMPQAKARGAGDAAAEDGRLLARKALALEITGELDHAVALIRRLRCHAASEAALIAQRDRRIA